MTKKDYELFANMFLTFSKKRMFYKDSGTEENADFLSKTDLFLSLVEIFKQDNPSFQPDKFKRACYEGKHIRKSISGRV